MELRSFLTSKGADVREDFVYSPAAGHTWSTLPMGQALDHVGQFSLPGAQPARIAMTVDRPGQWRRTEVDAISPGVFGRYTLELAPPGLVTGAPAGNTFALVETSAESVASHNAAATGCCVMRTAILP